MPKVEGIARKPPPEILEELIPPWTEAKRNFFGGKISFFTTYRGVYNVVDFFLGSQGVNFL